MADQFPMPKPVEASRTGDYTPYAPKRGLEAVADAVDRVRSREIIDQSPATLGQGGGTGYKSPANTANIRDSLKKLTHREMRELVTLIFAAHKKIDGAGNSTTSVDAIARADMADVLDAFAYGEP